MKKTGQIFCTLLLPLLFTHPALGAENGKAANDNVAVVNGTAIGEGYYHGVIQQRMREKYYHGSIPDEELEGFIQGILDTLIDDELLEQEARRRGLQPDEAAIGEKLAAADRKNADNPYWQENRAALHRIMRETLAQRQLIEALEAQELKKVTANDDEVRRYYHTQQDKFTTPEKIRVSTIVLTVDPSASAEVWGAAKAEAEQLLEQLRDGADFAQLAMIKSGHESAENGGDMGYIHRGMLAEAAQQALDKLSPGELSPPVRLLEGMAVFRLEERLPAEVNPFDQVKERARSLLLREKEAEQLEGLKKRLRESAEITINREVVDRAFVKTHAR